MVRPRSRAMSVILQELHTSAQQQEREIVALRAALERLRSERDELVAQLQFAAEQANRETRAAGSLRQELLARESVPPERVDFCCDDGGETTAVLPLPRIGGRGRRQREDDTERCIRTQ